MNTTRTNPTASERFVYVTYIATTVERLWHALIDGGMTRQYMGGEHHSAWTEGAPWEHRAADPARTVKIIGKVIEIRPPRRLMLTWAEPGEATAPEQHSRVAYDLEPVGDLVRLTVTHDQLIAGAAMTGRIMDGWPRVLSGLKTLLETGKTIALPACASSTSATHADS